MDPTRPASGPAGLTVQRSAPVRRRFRTWASTHGTLLDGLLVLVLDLWVLGHDLHDGGELASPTALVLGQLLVLPLIVRRRYPSAVFGFMAAVAFAQWLADLRLLADVALLIVMYTVAAHESRARAFVAAAVMELGVVLASIRFAPAGDGLVASLIFLSGLVAAVLFGGITLRTRRQYLAALVERAERLEFERDQQARLAATAERTREPVQATEAMYQVAATGRASLAEMRKLLGILRDSDAGSDAGGVEFAPQPGLDRLDALISDVRAAGMPIQLSVVGTPRPLAPIAQSAAFRIVQESLTNVFKHARRARQVVVELRWEAGELRIDITDDGELAPTGTDGPGLSGAAGPLSPGGHGMIGMRERAALFDGTLVAGPGPEQGWRVTAMLPVPRIEPIGAR
jgi:hypothetical protein